MCLGVDMCMLFSYVRVMQIESDNPIFINSNGSNQTLDKFLDLIREGGTELADIIKHLSFFAPSIAFAGLAAQNPSMMEGLGFGIGILGLAGIIALSVLKYDGRI